MPSFRFQMLFSSIVSAPLPVDATWLVGIFTILVLFGPTAWGGTELLTPGEALQMSAKKAKFDFLAIDPERRRLLGAHTGNGTLEVIDLDQAKLLKSVPTGAAQDCAVDSKQKCYLVSVSKPPQVAMVDADTLEVIGTVALPGPADLLTFDPNAGVAYVCHDDGAELWVVSPGSKEVSTIPLPSEGPEDLVMDAAGNRLFQAMKIVGTMAVFDVATKKLLANWPTAPAAMPHGIALVPEAGALAISGGNGKLVLMSEADGKILSSGDIPLKVDQIAYDAGLHRVYCASALGKLAVFAVQDGKLASLGEVTTSEGARSVAVDPKTHTVWVAYVKGDASFVQPFNMTK